MNAKDEYEARRGFWNGNVGFDEYSRVKSDDFCSHCGRYIDFPHYEYSYEDKDNRLCHECYELFIKFNSTITHHYPGCVEVACIQFYVWKGWDQFVKDHRPAKGWHYEVSYDYDYEWKSRRKYEYAHIMDVKDDQSEEWVLWHVRDESIVKDIRGSNAPEWRRHR